MSSFRIIPFTGPFSLVRPGLYDQGPHANGAPKKLIITLRNDSTLKMLVITEHRNVPRLSPALVF